MPSRMLRESICASETLAALSAEAERLFYRLMTQADDYGRFDARLAVVRSRCFQLGGVSDTDIGIWLGDLHRGGLVRIYVVDHRTYGHFPTWAKYQRIRSPQSRYPDPPQDAASCGDLPQFAAPARAHASGSDNGVEDEVEVESNNMGSASPVSRFADFWVSYPKKRHKPAAKRAWNGVRGDAHLEAILVGLERWKASFGWQRGYVEDPATFLRQRQWEDAVPAAPQDRDDSPAAIAARIIAKRGGL